MAYGETINIFDPTFKALADDSRILLQAAYMRLTTEPGTYWDDPDYGLLISEFVNADLTEDELLGLQSRVKSQLELDERIDTANVSTEIAQTAAGDVAVKMGIRLVPNDGEALAFTLNVTEVTVELLTGGAAG